MAKAILKFDLAEESNDFKLAVNAKEIMSVLWEVDQELRLISLCQKIVKY